MSTSNAGATPRPTFPHVRRTTDSADFYDAAADGRVLLRRCDACGMVRGPQVRWCPECHEAEHQIQLADGIGRIVSWAVVHRPPHPTLEADAPYVAALVELVEGPWLPVRVVVTSSCALRAGMPLRLVAGPSAEDGEAIVFAEEIPSADGADRVHTPLPI